MKKLILIVVLFVFVFQLSLYPVLADGTEVTNGYLKENKAFLRAVAYGNGTFVAVGRTNEAGEYHALIVYSKDGCNWKEAFHDTKSERILNDVLWTGERFMAVGEKGSLLISKDGAAWEEVAHNIPKFIAKETKTEGTIYINNDLASIVWNGKVYIIRVQGYYTTYFFPYHAYISKDGVTWEGLKSDKVDFRDVFNMTAQGNRFIAVEGDSNIKPYICWSEDGVVWDKAEPDRLQQPYDQTKRRSYPQLNRIVWDGQRFIVPATAYYTGEDLLDAYYFYTSKDGKSLSLDKEEFIAQGLEDFICVDGNYFMSASQGKNDYYIYYSTSKNFIFQQKKLHFSLGKMVKGGNTFVSVGDNIATSNDGINWSPIKSYAIGINVNDEELLLDSAPVNVAGRSLVPVRAIAEALFAKVQYDAKTKKITITTSVGGNKTLELQIDSNKAYVNGKEVLLDVPATISNGRTLVPVRFISECLGAEVSWDDNNQTVVIKHEEARKYRKRIEE